MVVLCCCLLWVVYQLQLPDRLYDLELEIEIRLLRNVSRNRFCNNNIGTYLFISV